MRRIVLVLTVAALMVATMLATALPAFAGGGDDCNSTNSNSQLLNANVAGNQTQGSCNDSNIGVGVSIL